jgi:hypothetical protein
MMVAVEDTLMALIAKKFGTREDDIVFSATIPGLTTVTTSISFPSKDAWIKVDMRFGNTVADVFELSMIADGDIAAQNLLLTSNFMNESWKCVSGSVIMNSTDVKIVNTDTSARDFIIVIRGFLIPKIRLDEFIRELQTVYQKDETIEKIAAAIAKRIK